MKSITLDNWYELNKDVVNKVYDEILNHISTKCYIPKYCNKNIVIDYDRFYDDLTYYPYKNGNSRYIYSSTYMLSLEQYDKKLDKYNQN